MRVIAGEFKGRRLHAPAGRGTRPTSGRARSGLFDWLGPRLEGARVLDLFAGSGALGIEALSRGASDVVFVESARDALHALRENCGELGVGSRVAIRAGDVGAIVRALAGERNGFDLVLADPPYRSGLWTALAEGPDLVDILRDDAVVIAERARSEPVVEDGSGLVLRDSRRYGETAFDWYDVVPRGAQGDGEQP